MGWGTYFAFIFAAINTLVVTYYLAIEKIPALEVIFPSFAQYALIICAVGVPVLICFGFIHFKRTHAFGSEQEVAIESNPFNYKLPPGHSLQTYGPTMLAILRLNLKILNKESVNEEESKKLLELIEKWEILNDGGWIGKPKNVS